MSLSSQIKGLHENQIRHVRRPGVAGELVLAATVNLFTITGGDILVYNCYGKVTTNMAVAATTVQLRIIPTGGAQQAISAASANLSGVLADATIVPTGAILVAPVTEITYGVSIGNVAGSMATNTWILTPGIVNILVGGATNATGVIAWTMLYHPLDDGVNVAAV